MVEMEAQECCSHDVIRNEQEKQCMSVARGAVGETGESAADQLVIS